MINLLEPGTFYRDLFDFRRDFDEIFSRLMTGWPTMREAKLMTAGFAPPVEARTDPDTKKFYLRIALPGVDPKEVKLEVHGNTLTITGERRSETKREANFLYHEFSYGSFERLLPLPEGVDVEKLVAEFNHGVLELSAPMSAASLPRRIEIKPALKKVA
jgi:HSP20 family protein